MRRLIAMLAAALLAGAGVIAGGSPAHADNCELVLSEHIYNGANLLGYSEGLDGCAGDVYGEVQVADEEDGPYTVWSSDIRFYDDETRTIWLDGHKMPCWVRAHASFGDQEKQTAPAFNYNCSG